MSPSGTVCKEQQSFKEHGFLAHSCGCWQQLYFCIKEEPNQAAEMSTVDRQ